MARNKYPEETVNLILDVSLKLFIEKGYDETSIQDIIDNLGGLSNGALYYHFKSKESILIAVYKRMSKNINWQMIDIVNNNKLTGLQKIQEMFSASLDNPNHDELFAATPNLLNNPKLLSIFLSDLINFVIPKYAEPVIRQGLEDGSIKTDYPKETAETMMLLSNIWLNPLIYPMTNEEYIRKIEFFNHIMASLIPDLIDEEMQQRLSHFRDLVKKQNNS